MAFKNSFHPYADFIETTHLAADRNKGELRSGSAVKQITRENA